ncbi:hypothetical protein NC652_035180 [Populus alba x Populus x berolinensis]|nr:hypothetical protein NC652_035174 [Populus alba x Populus x berolinensis]KAJ6875724.1 hypothetical protein NC652_035180 [Populus alba x Populus x berolinensis]
MASFVHSSIDSNIMSTLLLLLNSLSLFPNLLLKFCPANLAFCTA